MNGKYFPCTPSTTCRTVAGGGGQNQLKNVMNFKKVKKNFLSIKSQIPIRHGDMAKSGSFLKPQNGQLKRDRYVIFRQMSLFLGKRGVNFTNNAAERPITPWAASRGRWYSRLPQRKTFASYNMGIFDLEINCIFPYLGSKSRGHAPVRRVP